MDPGKDPFLMPLAEWGVVDDAARATAISRRSAYRLRNSARGRAFRLAWQAALLLARQRLGDDLMSRAVNGCVELVYRDGALVGEPDAAARLGGKGSLPDGNRELRELYPFPDRPVGKFRAPYCICGTPD